MHATFAPTKVCQFATTVSSWRTKEEGKVKRKKRKERGEEELSCGGRGRGKREKGEEKSVHRRGRKKKEEKGGSGRVCWRGRGMIGGKFQIQ